MNVERKGAQFYNKSVSSAQDVSVHIPSSNLACYSWDIIEQEISDNVEVCLKMLLIGDGFVFSSYSH